MNVTGNEQYISAEAVPTEGYQRQSRLLDHMARDLYRAIPKMPKQRRRFAYNLIELIYTDAMFRPPMGDHPLQQPRVLFERQLVRLEEVNG